MESTNSQVTADLFFCADGATGEGDPLCGGTRPLSRPDQHQHHSLPPPASHCRRLCDSRACPFVYLSYHTTHTRAERRAETQCQRRSANSGQKTKRGIEGEDPAAAGIRRFFSLSKKSNVLCRWRRWRRRPSSWWHSSSSTSFHTSTTTFYLLPCLTPTL